MTRRFHPIAEVLEPRLLLSASSPVSAFDAPPPPDPAPAIVSQAASPELADATTIITLVDGEVLTLEIDPADLVEGADLTGIGFSVAPGGNPSNPIAGSGVIASGTYESAGIKVEGGVSLDVPVVLSGSGYEARLNSGVVRVTVEQSQFKSAELNVQGELDINVPNSNGLQLGGTIQGKYENGLIDLECGLNLRARFRYDAATFRTTFRSGTVDVTVEQSQFKKAEFEAEGEADVKVANSDDLLLAGTLQGKYENDLIDLDCSLTLREPWEYQTGSVHATLQSGPIGVKVGQSELQEIQLINVVTDVLVPDSTANASLLLNGSITNGTFKPGVGITFDALLNVTDDFVYEKGPVKATLKGGGKLSVDVRASDLKQVTFSGIETLVDVAVPSASAPLKLKATLDTGAYMPGEGVTFEASLNVTDDFVYKKGPVKATLKGGGKVTADIQKNDLKLATFRALASEVSVGVDGGASVMLSGEVNGAVRGANVWLRGALTVDEPFEHRKGRTTTSIMPGQEVELRTDFRGNLVAELAGVVIELRQQVGRRSLVLAGAIEHGRIADGALHYFADLSLAEPFVLTVWPRKVTLVDADAKVLVWDGELGLLLLSNPELAFGP